MARVCSDPDIVTDYLDNLNERNQMEKNQFRDIFTDYMDMMDEFSHLQDKIRELERENYQLRQSGAGLSINSSDTGASYNSAVTDKQKKQYENQIEALKQQLLKVQEGKLNDTDILMETTHTNTKLQEQIRKLETDKQGLKDQIAEQQQTMKDLTERLQEVEEQMSSKIIDLQEKEDQLEGFQVELKTRDNQLLDMEDKNKKLTQECQILTVRILEEKNKMVEIMNEANHIFEEGQQNLANSMLDTAPQRQPSGFSMKTMKVEENYTNILKPEYLNQVQTNSEISALPTEVRTKLIAHTDACSCMAFNPQGDMLATGGADKLVKLWSFKKRQVIEMASLKSKQAQPIVCLAFSLDNEFLASCSLDHRATIYSLRNGYRAKNTFVAHNDLISSCAFLYSSRHLITSSLDCYVKFWSIDRGDIYKSINTKSKVFDMSTNRSEQQIVTGHNNGGIKMWEVKSRDQILHFDEAHGDPVSCVKFTPDENYLVSISKDDCLKVWDIRQRKLLSSFEDDLFRIGINQNSFCISPNSQYAVCGSKNGGLFYYDIQKGELADRIMDEHKSQIVSVDWHPKNDTQAMMASVDDLGGLLFWSI